MKTIISHICIGMRKKVGGEPTDESVPVSKAVGEKGAVSSGMSPGFAAWGGGGGVYM